jgi:hypothetical protein
LRLGTDAWQVERIASMLNYFLFQLVGPQRKALRVKEPEKYEFRPKELLSQVDVHCSKKSDQDLCSSLFLWSSFLTGLLEGALGVGYLGILETNYMSCGT